MTEIPPTNNINYKVAWEGRFVLVNKKKEVEKLSTPPLPTKGTETPPLCQGCMVNLSPLKLP